MKGSLIIISFFYYWHAVWSLYFDPYDFTQSNFKLFMPYAH